MSFLRIEDPDKRDQIVQEYLNIKKKIQQQDLTRRLDEMGTQRDLTTFFKPVLDQQTEQTKNIISKLVPIQQEIKDLPRIPYTMSTPPLPSIQDADDFHSISSVMDDEPGPVIGPVAGHYLKLFTHKKGAIDKASGLHTDSSTGQFKIGNRVVDIHDDNIVVGGKEYEGTQGLWELIVKNKPSEDILTDTDLENYEEIMEKTHALRRNYDEDSAYPNASKSPKWKKFGKRIWNRIKEREGSGINTIIIPQDPNALVERLYLLIGSKQAGNTGVRNEIISICDELLRQNVITKKHYKDFVTI